MEDTLLVFIRMVTCQARSQGPLILVPRKGNEREWNLGTRLVTSAEMKSDRLPRF